MTGVGNPGVEWVMVDGLCGNKQVQGESSSVKATKRLGLASLSNGRGAEVLWLFINATSVWLVWTQEYRATRSRPSRTAPSLGN